jgi:fatty acid desaturase
MTKSRTQLPAVQWRDLVELSPLEKVWELSLCWPWLGLSIWCYAHGWWGCGALASFYLFLTGLRQSHNAQHYALGVEQWLQDAVLALLSIVMLASMHAVQVTHLHHHRHCLEPEDIEGATARMSWWRTLLTGPLFPLRLHWAAWRMGSANKRGWIAFELTGIAGWCGLVWFVLDLPALKWHTAAMLLGECCTGFFAVWSVHHDSDDAQRAGRTQRGPWINALTYSMFLHAEHHLFPAVPTTHLPELARRLDRVSPQIQLHRVVRHSRASPLSERNRVPKF